MQSTRTLPADLMGHRRMSGHSQSEFWARYGVTRSAASRYEQAQEPPVPIQILIWLEMNGRISETDLEDALTSVVKAYLSRQANAER